MICGEEQEVTLPYVMVPGLGMWRTTPAWMWREKLQWSSEVS